MNQLTWPLSSPVAAHAGIPIGALVGVLVADVSVAMICGGAIGASLGVAAGVWWCMSKRHGPAAADTTSLDNDYALSTLTTTASPYFPSATTQLKARVRDLEQQLAAALAAAGANSNARPDEMLGGFGFDDGVMQESNISM